MKNKQEDEIRKIWRSMAESEADLMPSDMKREYLEALKQRKNDDDE